VATSPALACVSVMLRCPRVGSSLTQSSFKSTIEFVEPNVNPINPKVDLKMRCTKNV